MDSKKIFYTQLNDNFVPLLREQDFMGSGQHFKRIKDEVVHAINIQNSNYGGSCCINLGLHFTFLPVCWDSTKILDPKKIKEIDCEFRARLAPKGKTDYSWKFDGGGLFGNTSKSIKHLNETFNEVGNDFFERFDSIESITSLLEISLLKQSDFIDSAAGIIMPVRGALTMARIYKHLGNRELQNKYATTGLQIIGNAKALKIELERLAI